MKMLATGGLGAVGSVLVTELRSRGYEVWASDLMNAGGINYVRCDLSRYRQVWRIFEEHRFDYVYPAAAEFGQEKIDKGYLG